MIIRRKLRTARKQSPIMTEIEDIIGADALFKSMNDCAKGVKWKGTVAFYRHHWPDEIGRLEEQLKDGTYRERRAKFFTITEPKTRHIMSIHFRDRIYQRSLNDVAIYPQVTRSFIADNYACQKSKGTLPARERLKEFLQRFYRLHGTAGYVLKIDIEGYYPNMDHRIAETMLGTYLDENTNQLAQKVLANLPGKIGYNPGSQIVQIVGITSLDKIDHFIKERLGVKFYIRYMDDFILIHESREHLERCFREIRKELENRKMKVSEKKSFIQPLAEPIHHLGFIYRLTETGKVVVLADPKKIKHEKKKIRRMIALVENGKLTKHDVDRHFKAWKASVRYGNWKRLTERMNKWYEEQWKELRPSC